MTEDSCS